MKLLTLISLGLLLTACSAAQVQQAVTTASDVTGQVKTLCTAALPLAAAAGPVAPYILAGCASDSAINTLAQDPSSVQWLNGLIADAQKVAAAK